MKSLLITPPLLQVNSPYPATAYLSAFLKSKGFPVTQKNGSLDFFLKVFNSNFLKVVFENAATAIVNPTEIQRFFLDASEEYISTIDSVVSFLQNRTPQLAYRIAARTFVPEGPRFEPIHTHPEILEGRFGALGLQDRAKHLASLYIDDLADWVRDSVDSKFELARYGESLIRQDGTFDNLLSELETSNTLLDKLLDELATHYIGADKPDVIGFSVPFPGNVYAAFRMAKVFKSRLGKDFPIVLGGGFVNTELRSLSDPRVFDFFSHLTYDDGEGPFLAIIEQLKTGNSNLVRTKVCREGEVTEISNATAPPVFFKEIPPPDYTGLRMDESVSLLEMLNPMSRFWSDLSWNKVIAAHGCYWKKCNFCDTSLDYINRYDPVQAPELADRMDQIFDQTKNPGFHFVDEAAPPALLKALAKELIKRKRSYLWWGNLRFDRVFDRATCELLAASGCVAVTGGIEVASERLLKLINKGVTLEQLSQVTHSFAQAGILVHGYLMYGFPSQTTQETIDSLEIVRQLFSNQCIHSAFWHRFTATIHSPIGKNPGKFGIEVFHPPLTGNRIFAVNDLPFRDSVITPHDQLGVGLRLAVYNYMLGIGLDADIREWFEHSVPKPKVNAKQVERYLGPKK